LQETEDGEADMELEEQDLAGVDLEHLEHAYKHKKFTLYPGINYGRCTRYFSTPQLGPQLELAKP
jgi:hypothetical protein